MARKKEEVVTDEEVVTEEVAENTEVAEGAETAEAKEPEKKGRPSKLTEDQVIDIRKRYNSEKKEDLAAEFGISTAYLYKVATGMAAKDVDFKLVPKPEKPKEEPAAADAAVAADNTVVTEDGEELPADNGELVAAEA